jgi:hypothetical protein
VCFCERIRRRNSEHHENLGERPQTRPCDTAEWTCRRAMRQATPEKPAPRLPNPQPATRSLRSGRRRLIRSTLIESRHAQVLRPSFGRFPLQERMPERTNSYLASVRANARGRNATFPSLRPVLADQCRTPRGCLPTMRVQLRGYSSAQRFRARSRR